MPRVGVRIRGKVGMRDRLGKNIRGALPLPLSMLGCMIYRRTCMYDEKLHHPVFIHTFIQLNAISVLGKFTPTSGLTSLGSASLSRLRRLTTFCFIC